MKKSELAYNYRLNISTIERQNEMLERLEQENDSLREQLAQARGLADLRLGRNLELKEERDSLREQLAEARRKLSANRRQVRQLHRLLALTRRQRYESRVLAGRLHRWVSEAQEARSKFPWWQPVDVFHFPNWLRNQR